MMMRYLNHLVKRQNAHLVFLTQKRGVALLMSCMLFSIFAGLFTGISVLFQHNSNMEKCLMLIFIAYSYI